MGVGGAWVRSSITRGGDEVMENLGVGAGTSSLEFEYYWLAMFHDVPCVKKWVDAMQYMYT